MAERKNAPVKEPTVSFTPWAPWAERNAVKNAHLPGVYLLAHCNGPPGRVDPLDYDIVYISSVTESSLMGRWQQFHRAAFEGKPGHTGGLAYRDFFGDEGENLYVSAFAPESLPRELRTLFLRYTEHRLLWEWARRWGSPPVCNTR
jgi:hypothetical protein